MNAPRNRVVRVQYSKRGKVRFVSHRDMARAFERAIRLAGVPIAYSEGFSPRPRFAFGLALPTTFESDAEFVDVVLAAPIEPADLPAALTAALPDGIDVHDAAMVPPGSDSLQEAVTSSSWRLDVLGASPEQVQAWIESVVSAPTIEFTQERKGKPVTSDIRPAVLSLQPATEVADAGPPSAGPAVGIVAELATKPRGLRPLELLHIFDPGYELLRGRRLTQWISPDGSRRELTVSDAAAATPHSELCAL